MTLREKIEQVLVRVYGVRPYRGEFEGGAVGANEMAEFLAKSIREDFEVKPRRARSNG